MLVEMAIGDAYGDAFENAGKDLPRALHDGLENGPWGKAFLLALDVRLEGLKTG
jgi:hypothetical protein